MLIVPPSRISGRRNTRIPAIQQRVEERPSPAGWLHGHPAGAASARGPDPRYRRRTGATAGGGAEAAAIAAEDSSARQWPGAAGAAHARDHHYVPGGSL